MNRYPYNNGHLMIVPFAHVPALTDLASEDAAEIIELTRRCQVVVQEAMRPQGFTSG